MLVAALLHASAARAQQAYFTGLGYLPGDDTLFTSRLSADGSTVVGTSSDSASPAQIKPFRWTRGAGMIGLGALTGFDSLAPHKVSADGSTVVGIAFGASENKAVFRWTSQSGITSLLNIDPATFPGGNYHVGVNFIADDGSLVFGNLNGKLGAPTFADTWTPFRWKPDTGVVLLPKVVNGISYNRIELTHFSDDGAVALGRVNESLIVPGTSNQTVRWTEADGFQFLAPGPNDSGPRIIASDGSAVTLVSGYEYYLWSADGSIAHLGAAPPGEAAYYVSGISDGGAVVGGSVKINGSFRAARWTIDDQWQALPTLPGGAVPGESLIMSADGSIMVGGATGGTDSGLYIWDAIHGSRNLHDVLVQDHGLGASLAGWSLTFANLISPDGRTVVGQGINPAGKTEAWIAYLGTPVPEPSALVLAGLALAPLMLRRQATRRRAAR